ncbi:MAG: hypothetical protein HKN41_10300 [Ilumatobacter sp.]|nr:hypothetical protein [Ilumatobacter sp.]
MGIRDRFYTPRTAKAILSWRILAGIGAGVVLGLLGTPVALAVAGGAVAYGGLVATAMPERRPKLQIDPFTLGEPWRQLMQSADSAARKLRRTVADTSDGPLRSSLESIAARLEHGLIEAWEVAKRGDEIDDAVRRLDPTALRSKRDTLQQQADRDDGAASSETASAIASVERQLATADRLKQQSAETAATLRLMQTQLDELVARATEVRIGAADTETYRREVDELVIELEALHQAVEETRTA